MEKVSRFSSNFVGKTVASGSKVGGSAYPQLIVTSTKDKFVLNGKALSLMKLAEGLNVVMIDVNRGEVTTQDSNARWFLTAGWDKGKGNFEGAKIGKNGSFSYAGIYSAMQMNKPDIAEAKPTDMVAAGLGIFRDEAKKEGFIATQKVNFKVERLAEEDADGNLITDFEVAPGIKQPVYCLTELEVVAHTPRSAEEEEAEIAE